MPGDSTDTSDQQFYPPAKHYKALNSVATKAWKVSCLFFLLTAVVSFLECIKNLNR